MHDEETGLCKKHYSVSSSLRYSSELAIIAEGENTVDMIALIDIEWGADKSVRCPTSSRLSCLTELFGKTKHSLSKRSVKSIRSYIPNVKTRWKTLCVLEMSGRSEKSPCGQTIDLRPTSYYFNIILIKTTG